MKGVKKKKFKGSLDDALRYNMPIVRHHFSAIDSVLVYFERGFIVWDDKLLRAELFLKTSDVCRLGVFLCGVTSQVMLEDITVSDARNHFEQYIEFKHIDVDHFLMASHEGRERTLDKDQMISLADTIGIMFRYLTPDFTLLDAND